MKQHGKSRSLTSISLVSTVETTRCVHNPKQAQIGCIM